MALLTYGCLLGLSASVAVSIGQGFAESSSNKSAGECETTEASFMQNRRQYDDGAIEAPCPHGCRGCLCKTCGKGGTPGCAATQTQSWCNAVPDSIWCGGSTPTRKCSPAPPPPPANTIWEGFATASSDGPGDAPFCGKKLPDASEVGVTCYTSGVSVPWSLLCREFKSKPCLLYHMCPQCWAGDKSQCQGQSPPEDTSAPPPNCPNVDTYKGGLDKLGICWEAQQTKWLLSDLCYDKNGSVVGEGPGQGPCFNAITDDINAEDAVEPGTPTYLFKMAVGCGGNCYATNSQIPTDVCPKPSGNGFPYNGDCFNDCKGVNTENPCDPPSSTNPETQATCMFSEYVKNLPDGEPININNVRHQSCIAPFNDEGSFQPVPSGGTNRNWCSGTNVGSTTDKAHQQLNFDMTNNVIGFKSFGEYNAQCTDDPGVAYQCQTRILRHRRVQCPAT